MIEQDKKIRKGLTPRREAPCLLVERDIVIPAGTILRQVGQSAHFSAQVGVNGEFTVMVGPSDPLPPDLKRVIAA